MASYKFNNLSILIIDDNADMRNLVKQILYAFGCTKVVEASDGAEAFEKLKNNQADIIITDWVMKPVNGLEFVKMLRQSPDSPCPFAPVIMLTGHTEANRVTDARDAGVTEFLSKPISAKKLYSHIAEIIERPRQFIKAEAYVGPDRRRRQEPYDGPLRRKTDGIDLPDNWDDEA